MPNSKCQFAIVLLFLISLLEEVKSLRCYHCQLSTSDSCGDPFDLTKVTLAGECKYPDDVCVKHKRAATYVHSDDIKRGCVNENYCDKKEIDFPGDICETCSSYLCNSSVKVVTSSGTIISFASAYILRFLA